MEKQKIQAALSISKLISHNENAKQVRDSKSIE